MKLNHWVLFNSFPILLLWKISGHCIIDYTNLINYATYASPTIVQSTHCCPCPSEIMITEYAMFVIIIDKKLAKIDPYVYSSWPKHACSHDSDALIKDFLF